MERSKTKLDDVEAFIEVARTLSFSAAARELGLSKSVVTRRIQRLEATLCTQLIERTTRRLKLSEEGALYYRSLKNVPSTLRAAEERLQQRLEKPVGHMKIILPSYLGSSVITRELIPNFLLEHPDVSMEVRLSDVGPFDVPRDVDLLIMTRLPDYRLPDSTMRERKLARLRSGVFATPSYLKECGRPDTPTDLANHRCVSYLGRQWRFKAVGQPSTMIEVNGCLVTGSNEALKGAVKAGCGLVYSLYSVFEDELERGEVVPVLEPWTEDAGLALRMLMPGHDFTPLRVQLFADALSQQLGLSKTERRTLTA